MLAWFSHDQSVDDSFLGSRKKIAKLALEWPSYGHKTYAQ